GVHIATIYGMLWHIFENGWEDKEFIQQRVYGIEDVRKEAAKWTPDEVERVTGLPEAQVKHIAEVFSHEKPATLIWAMGQTQFAGKTLTETPGIPSTRWFDATLLPKDQVSQPDTLQAMFVMGHGVNTITRMPEAVRGMEKLELLVVCDPYPTAWSVLSERKNG